MRPSTLPWRLAATVCTLSALVHGAPSVNVALEASFDSPPFLVELLETAASENSTCYFPLLDRIADGTFSELVTEKELYETFVTVLREEGHLRDAEALSSFKFALSLHAAAPRIQAQFQYYNTSVQPHLPAAQDAACPVWVYFEGQQYCSPTLERAQQPFEATDPAADLPFDRLLGLVDRPSAILYADITHPLFADFHKTVSKTAQSGKSSYRVRYRPSTQDQKRLTLGGYGVELALKRTDYIVIDDREAATTNDTSAESTAQLTEEEELTIKPLAMSELANLGFQTSDYIIKSSDPMKALVQVTSDFPKFASFLSAKDVSDDFVNEHKANRDVLLPGGFNVLWINGLQIENRKVNAYSLLDHMRRERKLIGQMKEIGLSPSEAVSILSHDTVMQAQAGDTVQRFDWRDELDGGGAIIWMNDLEKDKRYASWPKVLTALFQRSYPGSLPSVGRDIQNAVFPVDLAVMKDIELVVGNLQNLVKRTVPVRIGIVPTGAGELAEQYAKLSYHLIDTYGISTLLKFYQEVVKAKKLSFGVEKQFTAAIADREPREGMPPLTYQQVLDAEDGAARFVARDQYLERLELTGPRPPFIVNGAVMPRSETWFESMSSRIFMDHQMIQQAVYEEAITDEQWVPDFFLFKAVSRRNGLVIPHDPKDIKVVDVASIAADHPLVFDKMPRFAGSDPTLLSDRAHVVLVADLDSSLGRSLLKSVLHLQDERPEIEILVIHNGDPEADSAQLSAHLHLLIAGGGNELNADQIRKLRKMLWSENGADHAVLGSSEGASEYWASAKPLLKELGCQSQQTFLWLNGRLVGPIEKALTVADLALLHDYELSSRIAPVTTAITGLSLEHRFTNPLDLAKITSIVARSQKSDLPEGMRESAPLIRMDRFNKWNDSHTVVKVAAHEDPTLQVVAVIDPVSEIGQSWVPILMTLSELDGVNLKVFLNPKASIMELPVKRFYRQVIAAEPTFDNDGALGAPTASFQQVPQDILFNLGMILPPSWLVAPKAATADPDNIKFSSSSVDQEISATYELEYIMIEGHARDVTTGPPPRGVQLLLGSETEPHHTDTIVMANLGYFQFKANPGLWQMSLKPGRSSKIFALDSAGANGYAAQPGDETTSVALLSFQGLTLYPRLSRNPGMDEEDVLEDTAATLFSYASKASSFASSALSTLGLKKSTRSSTNADINIFSVASGHLYERMLNIMMLSVMKHTSHTVKFWFIEQFLSPSFKTTLPDLAEHYGFEYEMVTYKWPHWLRAQREKQREIWGYKILFLDVLFPLDLDKVIFVDADQIVRTDMMELNRVDLHGAPYGFTPMCDSRTEMEGFRFWKQGYWDSYLRGKPYHISALYVVDLKKFREIAAGDRLRQQYQALSADPASLSNLDQDLPNHMQHSMPIFSLPQDWLWCETWCSDEALNTAKTIDLCNNPQTKEPKLDRARRQVPEWTVYDEEIKAVIDAARGVSETKQHEMPSVQEDEVQNVIRKDEL